MFVNRQRPPRLATRTRRRAAALLPLTMLWLFAKAAPVFVPDAQPVAYVGQIAVTNLDVTSGKEFVFAVDYTSETWCGNLHKYPVAASGEITIQDAWPDGAAARLDAQDADAGRRIVTLRGARGIPFRWQALSPEQRADLDPATAARPLNSTEAAASPLLDFLRGDRSHEFPAPPGFRERASALGDIIHATPVFCPARLCTVDTVFVGANDGMLHVFDAHTGQERFAYMPSFFLPKLRALAQRPYQHRYFLDGRLALRQIGSTTVLVGTLGAGGKGAFALDVSHAAPESEAVAASKVLWEISPETPGFENLGNTYAQPTMASLKTGETVLLLANGYHNTGNGHAMLLLVDPLTGKKLQEIDTHAFGGTGTLDDPNGLSSPSVWSSEAGSKIDTAFAGDLDGSLWKFDLVKGTATKLHTTQPRQAITTAPALMKHPFGGALVVFATGRLLTPEDAEDRSLHYAYGIWDSAPSENSALLVQTLTEVDYASQGAGARVRIATDHAPDWTKGHHKGWQTPLPSGGERVLGDGAFITRRLFQFISSNPTVHADAHKASTSLDGENWWMQLNALTGGGSYAVRFDLNRDGFFSTADQLVYAQKRYSPVGVYLGGGARSQMLPLITTGGQTFHASFDNQYFLTPLSPPSPMHSAASVTIKPGHIPPSSTPGGVLDDSKPTPKPNPKGVLAPAERLGRINWREIQQ